MFLQLADDLPKLLRNATSAASGTSSLSATIPRPACRMTGTSPSTHRSRCDVRPFQGCCWLRHCLRGGSLLPDRTETEVRLGSRTAATHPARVGITSAEIARRLLIEGQLNRRMIAPTAMKQAPAMRDGPTRSLRTNAAMAAAKRMEVSRRAATTATGAMVIAHSARP